MLTWLYGSLFIKIHPINHKVQLLSEKGKILDRLRNDYKMNKKQKQQPEEMEILTYSQKEIYIWDLIQASLPNDLINIFSVLGPEIMKKIYAFFSRTLVKCRVGKHY